MKHQSWIMKMLKWIINQVILLLITKQNKKNKYEKIKQFTRKIIYLPVLEQYNVKINEKVEKHKWKMKIIVIMVMYTKWQYKPKQHWKQQQQNTWIVDSTKCKTILFIYKHH